MAKIAGPATTIKFLDKDDSPPSIAIENPEKHGFLPGKHWVDHVGEYPPNSYKAGPILVIEQPADQYCAVTGGIMATRMKAVGIKGTVVGGRVRDLRELRATGLPVCDLSWFYG
jgi:regulator of RNase E activity RraA